MEVHDAETRQVDRMEGGRKRRREKKNNTGKKERTEEIGGRKQGA